MDIVPRRVARIVKGFVVLALPLLSGCIWPMDAPGGTPASAAPEATTSMEAPVEAPTPLPMTVDAAANGTTVLPFGVQDCLGLVAFIRVPVERLAPHVPPGFKLRSPQVPGITSLAIEADRCASMTGLNGPIQGGLYGAVWAPADPPLALRIEKAGGYFVGWDSLIPDADRRALMEAALLPVRNGSIVSVFETTTGGAAFADYRMTMDGLGEFETAATGPNPPLVQAGVVIQYNPSADGTLSRWVYDWRSVAFGTANLGTVRLPEGSWIAEVVGANAAPAQVFVGLRMTYDQGTVEFPIPNPAAGA